MSSSFSEVFLLKTQYEDEFGKINPQILRLANIVWQKSGSFFSNLLRDQSDCQRILLKAASQVSRKYEAAECSIENPTAYLYSTFRHLILAELKRQKHHSELDAEFQKRWAEENLINEDESIYRKILIQQLCARMDDWTREVFEMQVLGYQYKDLVPKYGASENIIRSKYSKALVKLKNRIQEEISRIESELIN